VKALLLLALAACQSSDVSRALGAECTSSKDCDTQCATGSDWPDGMCTSSCTTDKDCPDDSVCAPDLGGVCTFICTVDANCAFLGPQWGCRTLSPSGELVCAGK
jgi:hypothetical protein